ncbi:MAG: peptidyl-prolyl cis-trans isomerase [Terriglobia bacterium]
MLKLFRQRKAAVRIMLFGVVGVVGLMMVVTLVPGVGSVDLSLRDPQGLLARVGNLPVTQAEAQKEFRLRIRQFGTQSPIFQQLIRQNVVNDLITQRAVEYQAERIGMAVPPEEVALRLRQFSLFYPGGKFVGPDVYRQLVQAQFNMQVPEFERTLRQQALVSKVIGWVTAGLTVSSAEVEEEYRRRTEQVQIEFALLKSEESARKVQRTEEELRGYFEQNRDRYQLPERRRVRFVPLDRDVLRGRLPVNEQELEDYYRGRLEYYRVPERVLARHILLLKQPQVPATPPVEEESEPSDPVRQEAEDILARLRKEADFAALAREHSQHADSRDKGGLIGWVQRGQVVPQLEQVLFSLPPGGPAALVETSYGFHVVQVMAHEQERLKSLAEVRGEIEPVLREEKVQREVREQARRIVEAVRAGQTLEEAARKEGWPVRESPWLARDQALPSFGQDREFQEAAFRLPAETAGQENAPVSDPVLVAPGYAVLQLQEVSPAHAAEFSEASAEVESAYRQQRGAEQAREKAQRLAAAARESGNLRRAARRQGVKVKTSELFNRDGVVPDLGSVRDIGPIAFRLQQGSLSEAMPVAGNWIVFRVIEHQEADLSQLTEEEKSATHNSLLNQKRTLAWTVFTESLKKKLIAEEKLKLNQAAIDRFVGQS